MTSPMPCLTWMTAVDGTLLSLSCPAKRASRDTALHQCVCHLGHWIAARGMTRMRTDLFDFPLPPERIALRPARPRDAARLLVVRPGGPLEDRVVRDLPELLAPGDQLVVNDTRVIPAQPARPAHRARTGDAHRGEPAQAARRLALARVRQAGEAAARRRRGALRRRRQGVLPRPARRDRRGEGRGRRGDARVLRSTGRCSTRRSPSAATCRCRPTSRRAAPPTSRTAPTTRPCSPMTKARSRRRPRGCISPTIWWRGCKARGIGLHTRHAACRRRDLPAGEGRGHRRSQDACRMRRRERRDRATR